MGKADLGCEARVVKSIEATDEVKARNRCGCVASGWGEEGGRGGGEGK